MLDPKTIAVALRMIADGLELLSDSASAEALTAATKPAETKKAETKPAETKKAETKPAETKDAKEADPAPEDEADGATDEQEEEKPKKAEAKKDGDSEVSLQQLQELAAQLLASGERRTLKSILDEVGVKSLSSADPKYYSDLLEKLNEAVESLDLT